MASKSALRTPDKSHSHGHRLYFYHHQSSMYTGYGSASPPLTNNPFLTQTAQSASSRFPDISSNNNNPSSFASLSSGSTMTGGSFTQQQQSSLYQQHPAQNPYGSPQLAYNSGYISPAIQTLPSPPPFQIQGYDNTFGQQQFTPHVSGSSYSYLSGSQQQPNSTYNPARQQVQNNPGYLPQFDPYGAIGQGWEGGTGGAINNNNHHFSSIGPSISSGSTLSSASSTSSSFSNSSFGVGPRGDSHPRDYIRMHKSQIEAWDAYVWKQFLNSFESLQTAWDERKAELMTRAKGIIAQGQSGMAYGGYFAQQIQQEAARVQQLLKEAESNFDSVAASLFQMQEVFHGYRQSGDASSKSRVREATNAALKSLPSWPSPI